MPNSLGTKLCEIACTYFRAYGDARSLYPMILSMGEELCRRLLLPPAEPDLTSRSPFRSLFQGELQGSSSRPFDPISHLLQGELEVVPVPDRYIPDCYPIHRLDVTPALDRLSHLLRPYRTVRVPPRGISSMCHQTVVREGFEPSIIKFTQDMGELQMDYDFRSLCK
jgi:hypothetical protein